MDQVLIKTEEENSNGEILLYYVDADGGNEEGVVTTIENIEQIHGEQSKDQFILGDLPGILPDVEVLQLSEMHWNNQSWSNEDIKRLLIFYIDNKESFISGITSKKHLWTVACKTMLIGKNANLCEMIVHRLKKKYAEVRKEQIKGNAVIWDNFDYCHKAFYDDAYVNNLINDVTQGYKPQLTVQEKSSNEGIFVVKKVNTGRSIADTKVEKMLKLYLKYKKIYPKDHFQNIQRILWENIASELAEENGEYWQKRFFNFKQHYIKMLEKRVEDSDKIITWPYMKVFDEIFNDDDEFNSKYKITQVVDSTKTSHAHKSCDVKMEPSDDWNNTELTVLVKYYFDCFHEFQDISIPDTFLWEEVGRLLDKTSQDCKNKYDLLKNEHLRKYVDGEYDLKKRIPMEIIFDNIISKETQIEFENSKNNKQFEEWNSKDTDSLVLFFYENILLFKDTVCHFVCWTAVSLKLIKNIHNCKKQWDVLIDLYNSILLDKKDDPGLQINWEYIDLFDRIFDYGMDTKLLKGYQGLPPHRKTIDFDKIGAKNMKIELSQTQSENLKQLKSVTTVNSRNQDSDPVHKILTFYIKNKLKFSNNRIKNNLPWQDICNEVGMTAQQCAYKLKNLKQIFTTYVQKELTQPEKPILWAYYDLCKKAFGYRSVKAKLRKKNSDDEEDWSPKEIKQLIKYFEQNFSAVTNDNCDKSKWKDLALSIGKSVSSCEEKFHELRKSYRKIKMMRERNSNLKVSWKYYKMINEIYESKEILSNSEDTQACAIKDEYPDEDYQCIIVIPEGEELTDISNARVIIQSKKPIDSSAANSTAFNETNISNKEIMISDVNNTSLQTNTASSDMNMEICFSDPNNVLGTKNTLTDISSHGMNISDYDGNDVSRIKTKIADMTDQEMNVSDYDTNNISGIKTKITTDVQNQEMNISDNDTNHISGIKTKIRTNVPDQEMNISDYNTNNLLEIKTNVPTYVIGQAINTPDSNTNNVPEIKTYVQMDMIEKENNISDCEGNNASETKITTDVASQETDTTDTNNIYMSEIKSETIQINIESNVNRDENSLTELCIDSYSVSVRSNIVMENGNVLIPIE